MVDNTGKTMESNLPELQRYTDKDLACELQRRGFEVWKWERLAQQDEPPTQWGEMPPWEEMPPWF